MTPTLGAGSVDQETCLVVSVSGLVVASFDGVGGFASGGPPSEFCGEDVDLSLQTGSPVGTARFAINDSSDGP
ncbi:MAG: hypothetical protein RI637_09200 [Acidimicrobiia bacterium]|nr:hypothetical protein [Acidimicrobiia bacterium]